jgi:PAS domain S-box-containing protein
MRSPENKDASLPLGHYLAVLAGIVIFPILLTALILGAIFITLERGKLMNASVAQAQSMASHLDETLKNQFSLLRALATSPVLDTHDYELFQQQLKNVAKLHSVQIVLRDPLGQELANSDTGWGKALPKFQYKTDAKAISKTEPVVFTSAEIPEIKPWIFAITLPIVREGRLVYFLDLGVTENIAQKFFDSGKLPKNWTWQALDGASFVTKGINGSTDASNDMNLQIDPLLKKAARQPAGSFVTLNRAGGEVMYAYAVSPLTGWHIGVAIPKNDTERPLWQMLSLLGLLVSVIATASLIAVVIINTQLRKSVAHLVGVSRELGQKEFVDPAVTGVKEFDNVSEAISAASIILREKNLQIRGSEDRIRALLDNLFVFVNLLDLNGRIIEANAAPMLAAGLTREDVIGQFIWDTYWWNWSPHVKEQMERAVNAAREGRIVRFEAEMRMAGGALHTIDFQLAPLRSADGRIAYLLPSAVDITERKALENRLHDTLAQLEATYASSSVGLFLMDKHLRFVAVNPQQAAINKKSIEEHLGKSMRDIMGDDAKQLEMHLRKVLKTGKPADKIEYTRTPDEGERTTRVYRASYYPVLSEDGKVQGISGTVQDIT